ncbi:MAG: beta-ketoacyl-ACP synthase II [Neisseriaceae bacterium]|nr:MAG: beta-ketoacyl-ACP synthase II [Neisseriaceae bacterium]
MGKRRVVVTGVGQVSPVGNTVLEAWDSLLNGRSGIATITRFDTSGLGCSIAGEVKNFNIEDYVSPKQARHMDLFMHYGIASALQAIEDAQLDDDPNLDKTRVGVIIGSGIGGVDNIENMTLQIEEKGYRKVSPFFIPSTIINLVAGHVSMLKGYQGPSYSLASACTTGTHSIGDSFMMIQAGRIDVAIAGGTESSISRLAVAGFHAAKALSSRNDDPTTACRPWDRGRDGFVMGEGAGVLVLEEYEHAKKRGAKVYAEVLGYGMSSDAYHMTAPLPDGSGAILGMDRALKDAQINPVDVDYINAHATSTQLGDLAEVVAIKKLFKDHAYNMKISSTKSMTGHLLGGAGGIESVYSILAIHHQIVPPTINVFDQDIENGCDLDFCANGAQETKVDIVLSNSFGFGGTNGTLIFGKLR